MMNEEYIKRLDFDSDTFEAMKTDMNFILQHFLVMMIREARTKATLQQRQRTSRRITPRTHQIAQKRTKTVQTIFLPQTRITTLKSTLPKLCSVLTEMVKRIQTSQVTITVMMTQRRSSQCLECQVT